MNKAALDAHSKPVHSECLIHAFCFVHSFTGVQVLNFQSHCSIVRVVYTEYHIGRSVSVGYFEYSFFPVCILSVCCILKSPF